MIQHEITLPLPPVEASPNSRCGWRRKARATREFRRTCGLLIKQATKRKRAISGLVTIDLDFYTYRDRRQMVDDGFYRPKDEDNALASCKAALDGIRDAGVIKGDSKKYLKIGEVRLYTRKEEHKGKTELVMRLSSNGDS